MSTLDSILKSLEEPMLKTLQGWIRTPSVKGEKAENAPFGKDVKAMLDKALKDIEALGFPVKNVDHYAMHADLGEGADKDALGILAHLDVVPIGDGWTKDPFGGEISDGKMFGRGTSDDKGPAVAALYAMLAVKKAGIPLKRKVRLILGCDEESGWEDMAYYAQHETMPDIGFSPDASYPVINIEKGHVNLAIEARPAKDGLQVVSWANGERTNVIPGKADAVVRGDEALAKRAESLSAELGFPIRAEHSAGQVHLFVEGVPGHSAYPEGAKNAIGEMLLLLRALGVTGPLKTMADLIGTTYDARGLNAQVSDSLSGALTCNLGIIRVDENRIYGTLDLRCPLLSDHARIISSITATLDEFTVTVQGDKGAHHVPENSELVQKLLEAYHEVTGLPRKAISTGGGTYSRCLKQGVAFGASFPDDPDVAHQANEYVHVDSLIRSMNIFARAIVKLAGK